MAKNAPLIAAGWRERITFFRKTEAEYFSQEDWTVESTLNRLAYFDFSRTRCLVCGERRARLRAGKTCIDLPVGQALYAVLEDYPRLTREDILAAQGFAAADIADEEIIFR